MSCSELVCTVIKNFFGGFEHEGICLTWYAPLRPTVGVLPMSAKSLVLKSRTSLDWTKNVSMDEEWCSTKGIKWKENHSRLLNLSHRSVTTLNRTVWLGQITDCIYLAFLGHRLFIENWIYFFTISRGPKYECRIPSRHIVRARRNLRYKYQSEIEKLLMKTFLYSYLYIFCKNGL